MSYNLNGRWKADWALDIHSQSSMKNLDGSFETVRSTIGEALYQLKYCQDLSKIEFLSNELIYFLRTRMVLPYIDVIIPTPSSSMRDVQPVHEIAKKVSCGLNITYDENYVSKIKNTSQLKAIDDANQRQSMIQGAFCLPNPDLYKNKKILIIDDLYRSGTTLNELTKILYENGNVNNVYIVTLTKTRTKL